jgi:CheY-like chemotaxis protein
MHLAANPPTVLVVEDDEDTRSCVMDIVRASGCEALGAEDAKGALFILRDRPVDAILTDYSLGPESETGSAMLCRAQDEGLLAATSLVTICTGSNIVPPPSVPIATVLPKPVDLTKIRADLAALQGEPGPKLEGARLARDDISVLFPNRDGTKDFAHEHNTKAPEGAVAGVGTGGVGGGALELLAGIARSGFQGLARLSRRGRSSRR